MKVLCAVFLFKTIVNSDKQHWATFQGWQVTSRTEYLSVGGSALPTFKSYSGCCFEVYVNARVMSTAPPSRESLTGSGSSRTGSRRSLRCSIRRKTSPSSKNEGRWNTCERMTKRRLRLLPWIFSGMLIRYVPLPWGYQSKPSGRCCTYPIRSGRGC